MLFTIKFNSTVHFKEVVVRTNLHGTVASVTDFDFGNGTASVDFDLALAGMMPPTRLAPNAPPPDISFSLNN
jgi:predicted amidohydrolase